LARELDEPTSLGKDEQFDHLLHFKLPTTRKAFDSLVDAFIHDYMAKKYFADKSGWRTLAEVAEMARISKSALYGKHSSIGPALHEPLRRGLIETRVFPGERGRGGEVMRLRIAYDREPIKEFVNSKILQGRNSVKPQFSKTVPKTDELDKRRIAVLPFENFSADTGDQYLADGMTEELISTMSKISGLKVIARTSVMPFKNNKLKKIEEIASELKAGTILEGSIRKSGDKLRVTVQLIDSGSSDHLWSDSYDREMKDVFAIQSDISQTVTNTLRVRLLSSEKEQIQIAPTKNTEAHAMCLRGIYFNINQIDFKKAIEYFEKAIELDPGYALAYAWLADSYGKLAGFGLIPGEDILVKIEKAASKSLELDPNLAEGRAALAWERYYRHDWSGMENEIRKALELNPKIAEAREYLSALLDWTGRFGEAKEEARKALEINPLSRFANLQSMGLLLFNMKEYDEAIEHLNKVLRFDPDFKAVHDLIGWCYFQKSMYKEAIEEFKKELDPSKGQNDTTLINLACAYARFGQRENALETLKHFEELSKKQYVPAALLSRLYLALGEKERLLSLLESAYEKGEYNTWISVNPIYDDIRGEPRFIAILKKMGISR
jgi:adenylate cyclase